LQIIDFISSKFFAAVQFSILTLAPLSFPDFLNNIRQNHTALRELSILLNKPSFVHDGQLPAGNQDQIIRIEVSPVPISEYDSMSSRNGTLVVLLPN
jgi:hypothetical protein